MQRVLSGHHRHLPDSDQLVGVTGKQGLAVGRPRQRQTDWSLASASHYLRLQLVDNDLTFQVLQHTDVPLPPAEYELVCNTTNTWHASVAKFQTAHRGQIVTFSVTGRTNLTVRWSGFNGVFTTIVTIYATMHLQSYNLW